MLIAQSSPASGGQGTCACLDHRVVSCLLKGSYVLYLFRTAPWTPCPGQARVFPHFLLLSPAELGGFCLFSSTSYIGWELIQNPGTSWVTIFRR